MALTASNVPRGQRERGSGHNYFKLVGMQAVSRLLQKRKEQVQLFF